MELKYRLFTPAPYGLNFEIEVDELKKYDIDILAYPPSKETCTRLVDSAMTKYCSEYASEEEIQICNNLVGIYIELGLHEEEKPHQYLDSKTLLILSGKIHFHTSHAERYNHSPIHDIQELLNTTQDKGVMEMLNMFGNNENRFDGNGSDAQQPYNYHPQDINASIERFENAIQNATRYTPSNSSEEADLYESSNTFIFEFSDIENVIQCAKGVSVGNTPLTQKERLYFHEGKYFLAMDILNIVPDNDVRNFLSRLTEYGKSAQVTKEVVEEYYKEIIDVNAVYVLATSF